MRQMTLVAFLQAQNCSNFVGSWRHPDAASDFTSVEYYQRIGRVLEAGRFHLGFFDDRLAMPDRYGGDHAHAVENGIRCVKMDPVTILTAMGMATERLGLGSTYSTTYYEPFHVARVFATLDLMSGGRAAWNVVTSMNDGEALNMGVDAHMAHDLRYDRADEFMEVVLGHWDSWEDAALVVDKPRGLFAHPDKVHRLDYAGKFFRSRGPFTVPRSAQGHPVIIQAGQSGRGLRFAARWGELVFVAYHELDRAKQDYAAFKAAVAEAGRDPELVKVTMAIYPVVAETRTEAEDRLALIERLPRDIDRLSLLSEVLNFDFATKGIDEPFTDDELANISGLHTMRDRVVRGSGKRNPTVRDFIEVSGRGSIHDHPVFCGTAADVADRMEQWFAEPACDGYVVAASHVPGAYDDFVHLVIPELQRRGLHQRDYAGTTLRQNLGLPRPGIGAWRTARH
ncbi:MAG TPA: LLM class flavin-dependent oxidoreductase [Acetobacteraceae bacterium]|nr:LLM class flavin-dependent oxidoreductase [Acetobacteraceae bacterium]